MARHGPIPCVPQMPELVLGWGRKSAPYLGVAIANDDNIVIILHDIVGIFLRVLGDFRQGIAPSISAGRQAACGVLVSWPESFHNSQNTHNPKDSCMTPAAAMALLGAHVFFYRFSHRRRTFHNVAVPQQQRPKCFHLFLRCRLQWL